MERLLTNWMSFSLTLSFGSWYSRCTNNTFPIPPSVISHFSHPSVCFFFSLFFKCFFAASLSLLWEREDGRNFSCFLFMRNTSILHVNGFFGFWRSKQNVKKSKSKMKHWGCPDSLFLFQICHEPCEILISVPKHQARKSFTNRQNSHSNGKNIPT